MLHSRGTLCSPFPDHRHLTWCFTWSGMAGPLKKQVYPMEVPFLDKAHTKTAFLVKTTNRREWIDVSGDLYVRSCRTWQLYDWVEHYKANFCADGWFFYLCRKVNYRPWQLICRAICWFRHFDFLFLETILSRFHTSTEPKLWLKTSWKSLSMVFFNVASGKVPDTPW